MDTISPGAIMPAYFATFAGSSDKGLDANPAKLAEFSMQENRIDPGDRMSITAVPNRVRTVPEGTSTERLAET